MTTPPTKPQGNTIPVQGEKQQRSLRTPNERDESADSQEKAEASQQRIGSAAHDSVVKGEVDTDKGPVLDATYDKVKSP